MGRKKSREVDETTSLAISLIPRPPPFSIIIHSSGRVARTLCENGGGLGTRLFHHLTLCLRVSLLQIRAFTVDLLPTVVSGNWMISSLINTLFLGGLTRLVDGTRPPGTGRDPVE